MKIFIISLFFLISCSSTPKKSRYTTICNSSLELKTFNELHNKVKETDKRIKVNTCHYKAKEDGKFYGVEMKKGLTYKGIKLASEDDEWIVPLMLADEVRAINADYSYVIKDGKYFKFHHEDQKLESVYYDKVFDIYLDKDKKHFSKYSLVGKNKKPGTLYINSWKTLEPLYQIDNVDSDITLKNGNVIKPYFTSPEGGYLIRHNINGEKSYRYYAWNGNNIDKYNYDEKDVYIVEAKRNIKNYSLNTDILIPFLKIKKNYYWPILFNDTTITTIPKEAHGIKLDLNKNEINHVDNIFVTWKDGYKGYIGKGFKRQLLGKHGANPQLYEALDNKDKRYKDVYEVKATTVFYDGRIKRNQSYIVFQKMDGKYYIRHDGSQDKVFNTRKSLNTYLTEFDKNAVAISNIKKQEKYQKEVADYNKKKAKYDNAVARQNNYINNIHKYGLGANGGTPSFEAAQYCSFKGPRCSFYQKQARQMLDKKNAKAEAANRKRLNDLYNSGMDEKTMIQNAKCRNQAYMYNRYAGKIKYGCKNKYGK